MKFNWIVLISRLNFILSILFEILHWSDFVVNILFLFVVEVDWILLVSLLDFTLSLFYLKFFIGLIL